MKEHPRFKILEWILPVIAGICILAWIVLGIYKLIQWIGSFF
jgi:hypothetical protein